MPATSTIEFKLSEVPQFETLARFLVEARELAIERGDDDELSALVRKATDSLAAVGDDPQ